MPAPSRPSIAACLKASLLGGAIAAVLNLALALGLPAAGFALVGQFDPKQDPIALPAAFVVMASLVPAIVAGLAYYGLSRLTDKAPRVFTIIATVLLLVSMGGPLTLVGADTTTKAVLAVMHIIAAVAIVRPLVRV